MLIFRLKFGLKMRLSGLTEIKLLCYLIEMLKQ